MKEIILVYFLIPLAFGGYLFYDTECPTDISKLEKSFYTGFRFTKFFSNFLTVDGDFELFILTYNRSNTEEIIRIDGSVRFLRNEFWINKYIPINSWPLYLHPNCLKFYKNRDECLPKMDTLLIFPVNDNKIKEPFKIVNYQFEQFFPCEPNKTITFSHENVTSLKNNSAAFISFGKPVHYIKNFNIEEFFLDNLYNYDESREQYEKIIRDVEELEEFTIKSDPNFKYNFEEPLGPFKKIYNIKYEDDNIVEI
uniref:Uncharacterized protein n=1 Tax=Strongyloides venezuelensis TaxID=75913 RepID=A0A0K0F7T6_STRVS